MAYVVMAYIECDRHNPRARTGAAGRCGAGGLTLETLVLDSSVYAPVSATANGQKEPAESVRQSVWNEQIK